MRNPAPLYEPRYYERAAQQHVARVLPGSCFINVPWGLTGSPTTRPELDAVVLLGRRVVPVEIKAYEIG